MNPTDEQISAWIDGNLSPDQAQQMAQAIAADSNLKDRIEKMRNIDRLVRMAVPEDTALPPELMERLGLKQFSAKGTVVPFAPRDRVAAASVQIAGRKMPWQSRWKIAAQVALVGFVGLGMALWLAPSAKGPEAEYHALGSKRAPDATAPTAIVLFDETVSADEARMAAEAVGGMIAGEQTAAGAWPIAIASDARDEALGKLRLRDDVILAEPVEGH